MRTCDNGDVSFNELTKNIEELWFNFRFKSIQKRIRGVVVPEITDFLEEIRSKFKTGYIYEGKSIWHLEGGRVIESSGCPEQCEVRIIAGLTTWIWRIDKSTNLIEKVVEFEGGRKGVSQETVYDKCNGFSWPVKKCDIPVSAETIDEWWKLVEENYN
jgi:hypothetical protein